MPALPVSSRHLARAVFLGALVLLGPGACRSAATRTAGRDLATLRIENHSDLGWRVELAPDSYGVASRDALRWEIPARAKQSVTVPAGTYHLRSRLADAANDQSPAAYERIELHAGTTQLRPLTIP
ncbi:MAG: hypothetical protein H7067_19115 [Burkholderiales bacterium]|nr:hypothetical protein [Opitutaceae bacterium]